jgi:hypothetical protein
LHQEVAARHRSSIVGSSVSRESFGASLITDQIEQAITKCFSLYVSYMIAQIVLNAVSVEPPVVNVENKR